MTICNNTAQNMILPYSHKKTNEKILLLYSVTYPAINSDSASVRSKGHLDVSSKKKIYSTSVSGKKKKKQHQKKKKNANGKKKKKNNTGIQ